MPTGNESLVNFIQDQLRQKGPLPFRWFMEQALYHPEHGYYSSGRAMIGRAGDFFTSVSIGPLFGKLMAQEFLRMWSRLSQPEDFVIVEQGAHSAQLARDVMDALLQSPMADSFQYRIVEPFPVLRDNQQETLRDYSKVTWHADLAECEPFCGVHFSNELFDALPVHLVRYSGQRWHELYVDEHFRFVEGPLSTPDLDCTDLPAIEGYQTEINLEAPHLMAQIAGQLSKGFVLALDYGWERADFYHPSRSAGTLSCYGRHRRSDNPLEQVGHLDITAHVEFTSLVEAAQLAGLRLEEFVDQHHFMVRLGSGYFHDMPEGPSAQEQKELRAFQSLMHPGLLGMRFKALSLSAALPQL